MSPLDAAKQLAARSRLTDGDPTIAALPRIVAALDAAERVILLYESDRRFFGATASFDAAMVALGALLEPATPTGRD